jgi:hypothetical protein
MFKKISQFVSEYVPPTWFYFVGPSQECPTREFVQLFKLAFDQKAHGQKFVFIPLS